MAIFIKRMISKKSCYGLGTTNPKEIANQVYNPLLQYLDEQYNSVAAGYSVDTSGETSTRDIDDENLNGKDWWEIDFVSLITQKYNEFNAILNGIKNGTLEKNENTIGQLYQAGEDCAVYLMYKYLNYAMCFEWMTGIKPPPNLDLVRPCGDPPPKPPQPHETGGNNPLSRDWVEHESSFGPYYTYEPDWTDWLLPWNWGKTKTKVKYEHEKERDDLEHDRTVNQLQHEIEENRLLKRLAND